MMTVSPLRWFIACALAISGATGHAQGETGVGAFSADQLSGWWVDNHSTDAACDAQAPRVKFEFSGDGKRVTMRFDRRWKSALGEQDRSDATILRSTARTMVIQYDDESRKKPDGRPLEWELAIVAPGVYRWRETSWPAGNVNIVVGIRCAP